MVPGTCIMDAFYLVLLVVPGTRYSSSSLVFVEVDIGVKGSQDISNGRGQSSARAFLINTVIFGWCTTTTPT